MSIDEQIRDTLLHRAGADGAPGVDPTVMGRIVDRAERRRRRKLVAGGTVLALAVAVRRPRPRRHGESGETVAPVDAPQPDGEERA